MIEIIEDPILGINLKRFVIATLQEIVTRLEIVILQVIRDIYLQITTVIIAVIIDIVIGILIVTVQIILVRPIAVETIVGIVYNGAAKVVIEILIGITVGVAAVVVMTTFITLGKILAGHVNHLLIETDPNLKTIQLMYR